MILRLRDVSVVHGFTAITPNRETAPIGPSSPHVKFTAPEFHGLAKVGMVHECRPTARENAHPMPTEPSFMHQVLAGGVHAVRDGFM